jgi:hypothetical protein
VQTACCNTAVQENCGDYPSLCHFSRKLASTTNKKERKKEANNIRRISL